jgi:hypothetical protein
MEDVLLQLRLIPVENTLHQVDDDDNIEICYVCTLCCHTAAMTNLRTIHLFSLVQANVH